MAIRFFEQEFTYDHFIREKEEKEALTQKKKSDHQSDQEMESENEEDARDLGVEGWDRQWAERIFSETKDELCR